MRRAPRRTGFTLVELLVVIAIIIILMALALVVVTRIWNKVDESRVTTEIASMAEKFQVFKKEFGRYPPSRLILCENGAAYTALISGGNQLAVESVEFLTAIFPGINLQAPVAPRGFNGTSSPQTGIGHDWAGRFGVNGFFSGVVPPGAMTQTYVLEGEEILVYFLGGMRYGDLTGQPNANSRTPARGFNSNKSLPCAMPPINGNSQRLGPFFEFQEDRIVYSSFNPPSRRWNAVPTGSAPGGIGYFPVYLDRFDTPYAYFAARPGTQNNYNGGDCANLMGGLFMPYYQSQTTVGPSQVTVFHKSDTFQIISAGRDQLFGTGGRYDRNNPEAGLTSAADFDNITNISGGPIVPK